MNLKNKGLTTTAKAYDRDVMAIFEQVSKAALMDVVIDQCRLYIGEEDVDGEALAAALVEFLTPRLLVREDKVPRLRRKAVAA